MFIAEIFESAELLTHDGRRATVDRDYMQFGYDTSTLHKQRDIALAVTFRLERGDEAIMHRIMQENLSWRGGKHPWLEYHPSAGSIFQKIEGVGAGRLIEAVVAFDGGAFVGDVQGFAGGGLHAGRKLIAGDARFQIQFSRP